MTYAQHVSFSSPPITQQRDDADCHGPGQTVRYPCRSHRRLRSLLGHLSLSLSSPQHAPGEHDSLISLLLPRHLLIGSRAAAPSPQPRPLSLSPDPSLLRSAEGALVDCGGKKGEERGDDAAEEDPPEAPPRWDVAAAARHGLESSPQAM
ncbi:hypothetical protein Taro_014200, partial [Colocasia esculenta]|nr:hypothetical protein [Colocasia esculenta]